MPRARAGATTLLAHPTLKGGDGKPAPVLVASDAGKGRALALLTDSGWHWGFLSAGEGDDGRAFQRFWENGIRWLVRDPALTLLRLELDRLEYRRNQPIAVRVRAMHADYSPAPGRRGGAGRRCDTTRRPTQAQPPTTSRCAALRATTDADGEAHVDVGTLPPGAYRLTGRATIDGRAVTHERDVRGSRGRARAGRRRRARQGAARDCAGRRAAATPSKSSNNVAIRASREVRIGRQQSVEIWSTPLLLLLGIALLTLEWALRRRLGHT